MIIDQGKAAEHLHVIIKGAVEARDGDVVEAVLGPKDSFDARASCTAPRARPSSRRGDALPSHPPKAIVLDLIRRNPAFAAFFYSERVAQARRLRTRQGERRASRACCARGARGERPRRAVFVDGDQTIDDAGRMHAGEGHQRPVRARRRAHRRRHRHEPVEGGRAETPAARHAGPRRLPFDVVAVDADDFVFEALHHDDPHNKRRLAVRSNGSYVGILEDIDILGLFAGNSQLIPGRIDRAAASTTSSSRRRTSRTRSSGSTGRA